MAGCAGCGTHSDADECWSFVERIEQDIVASSRTTATVTQTTAWRTSLASTMLSPVSTAGIGWPNPVVSARFAFGGGFGLKLSETAVFSVPREVEVRFGVQSFQ